MATKKKEDKPEVDVVVDVVSTTTDIPVDSVVVDVVAPVKEEPTVLGGFDLNKKAVRNIAIVRQSLTDDGFISIATVDGCGYKLTYEEYKNL